VRQCGQGFTAYHQGSGVTKWQKGRTALGGNQEGAAKMGVIMAKLG